MFTETSDLKQVLHFLRDRLYLSVPHELFDRYLWFYGYTEEAQHHVVYGRRRDHVHFAVGTKDGSLTAAAAVHPGRPMSRVDLHAIDPQSAVDMVDFLMGLRKRRRLSITVADETMALALAGRLRAQPTGGNVKYYTDKQPETPEAPVRELFAGDEYVLEQLHPRRWPAFRAFLSLGTRFFALITDGKLRAMCGLAQLTAMQAQVIGVETFDPSDRRKGYGSAVAAVAIREGLRDTPIVTWSTSQTNEPSCRTAESLGMRPYYALKTITATE